MQTLEWSRLYSIDLNSHPRQVFFDEQPISIGTFDQYLSAAGADVLLGICLEVLCSLHKL
jgi:hypothetical protein